MLKELFPVKVLLQPGNTFRSMDRTGWAWPLGLTALSMASAALLFTRLPPQFMAESFEGLTLTPGRGLLFYFFASLSGGLALSAFACAAISALCRFLAGGRLSLRLPAAALAALAFGLTSAGMYGASGAARASGLAAAAAAVLLAAWAAASDYGRWARMFKAMLSLSALALAGDIFSGLAALAGSLKLYAWSEYLFAALSLAWLVIAVAAVYSCTKARAAAAAVLGVLTGMALLFLAYNLGLLPEEFFKAMMLL